MSVIRLGFSLVLGLACLDATGPAKVLRAATQSSANANDRQASKVRPDTDRLAAWLSGA